MIYGQIGLHHFYGILCIYNVHTVHWYGRCCAATSIVNDWFEWWLYVTNGAQPPKNKYYKHVRLGLMASSLPKGKQYSFCTTHLVQNALELISESVKLKRFQGELYAHRATPKYCVYARSWFGWRIDETLSACSVRTENDPLLHTKRQKKT